MAGGRRCSPRSSARIQSTSTSMSARMTPSSTSVWSKRRGAGDDPGRQGGALASRTSADFPHKGKLDFLDNRLDAGHRHAACPCRATQSERFSRRDVCATERDGFGRVRGRAAPRRGYRHRPDQQVRLVVGDDGIATRRQVKLGPLVDGMRIVREGISADEWIVVRGQAARTAGHEGGAQSRSRLKCRKPARRRAASTASRVQKP